MLAAFTRRLQGDYGFDAATLTPIEVERTIEQATEFLAAAKGFLSDSV
jgi:hypothetical protein